MRRQRKSNNENSAVYTVEEVAEILGIGRITMFHHVKNGIIPSLRIGRRILIPKHVINTMFENAWTTYEIRKNSPSEVYDKMLVTPCYD